MKRIARRPQQRNRRLRVWQESPRSGILREAVRILVMVVALVVNLAIAQSRHQQEAPSCHTQKNFIRVEM